MGNDNKITDEQRSNQIHKEVMLFLGKELERIHQTSSEQAYDIEKEYAKTKKHRSPFSFLMLTGCFIVVFGIAFVMTRVISSNNEDITVSLTEFDDLNLKNLLDTMGAAQTNYDNAVKSRAAIEGDMTVKLNAAEDSYKNDLFVIDSMNLRSKKTYNTRVAEAQKKYKDTLAEIHLEFDGKLAQADKEIEEYKKQLSEFDTAKVQAAKEREMALDSERRVKELEQQRIKDQYESRIADLNKKLSDTQKQTSESMRQAVTAVSAQYQAEIATYDPKLADEDADKIIEEAAALGAQDFDGSAVTSKVPASIKELIAKYQNLYEDYKYIDKAVTSLPQKNSIPIYNAASRNLINGMGKTFVDTANAFYKENVAQTAALNEKINNLNAQLEKSNHHIANQDSYYQQSYETLMTLAKTNAILLFAEDYDTMPVYVSGKARYLITEEGAPAEFKAGKTIKGRIFREAVESESNVEAESETEETSKFYFVVGLDKEGNVLPVDFSLVYPGTPVKILSK